MDGGMEMTAGMKNTLADLRVRQDAGEHMPCPRCGRDAMDPIARRNALSRYADIFVCPDCGTSEAMLIVMNNPLPMSWWRCFPLEHSRDDWTGK